MTTPSNPLPASLDLSTHPVVVLDDDEDDIGLTTFLLRKTGVMNVPAFRDSEKLAAYLESNAAQVARRRLLALILDVKMPGMSGLDVLQWIRERPVFDPLPVIMWSSSDDPRDISAAGQRKAQCYVAKYPTVSVLREILQEAAVYEVGDGAGRFFRVPSNLLLGRDALPDLAVV